jgi:subtilisin family serine protease
MEATARSSVNSVYILFSLLLSLLVAGCGKGEVSKIASTECASQARAKSFLVKWKTRVPQEFQQYKIHAASLTTRFSNMSQAGIEKNILRKHLGEYEIAEHEFNIQNVSAETDISSNATTPPPVWAPQDIQLEQAWKLLGVKGDGVIVAVVDSGFDPNHPLLKSQIWKNPGENGLDAKGNDKATNGIDDDQDGLIDDAFGWNFNASSPDINDDNSHGTHVSGIIAAQPQLTNSFVGVAPNAKIMPLKFIDSEGGGSITAAINSVDYAVAHGAKVVNASWGGGSCSAILKQEIQAATRAGVVFVSAAGNGDPNTGKGYDISQVPEWPAVYQLAGKITVGSYNAQQVLSSFSNFGALVDLAGPGEEILSTVPPDLTKGQAEGQLAMKSGTSMATPYVVGVVALLFSAKPDASVVQITDAINNSVIPGRYGVRTSGKLNALAAAQYLLSH